MSRQKGSGGEADGLWLLLVFAAAVRLFFLLNYENMPGNATDSVVRAFDIIANPSLMLNFDGNRSTLFNYALALFLYFWRDSVVAPRVFTLIFGSLLVFPYYGTLKRLFDARIAFLSTVVLVFCPLHVVQSATATVDVVYHFFLFTSFYYFFEYRDDQGRAPAFWLAAVLFNVTTLLRFESWVFIPIFFLLLWPRNQKGAIRFLLISLVFPCGWLLLNKILYYDYFLTFKKAAMTSGTEIAGGTVPYDPSVYSWVRVLWRSSGASLVAAGFLGMIGSFLTRKKFEIGLFFLILLTGFTVQSCSGRMWHTERYSIILTLLIIPYAWFFADRVLAWLKIRRTAVFLGLLILPLGEAWYISQRPIATIPHVFSLMTEDVFSLAQWLKKNVRKEETVIIGADRFDVYPSYLMLRGGILPSSRCLVVWNTVPPFKNKEGVEQFIKTQRTAYLVLNSEGYLQKVLNFDLEKETVDSGGIRFTVMFQRDVPTFGRYVIYKISVPEPGGTEDP
ncbi:MAG: glycosyltransferase family 39 protein [Candidatus Omnitrophica bacterium]|nr:glycosyltransferase family 39 protein [Candidatus Omnitrophota bacterium]